MQPQLALGPVQTRYASPTLHGSTPEPASSKLEASLHCPNAFAEEPSPIPSSTAASLGASASSPASHVGSGTDTWLGVARNSCPQPCGSDPHANHSENEVDVNRRRGVAGEGQFHVAGARAVATSVMFCEFSNTPKTEQGPVVFTTGGSMETHPKSMTAVLEGPGQLHSPWPHPPAPPPRTTRRPSAAADRATSMGSRKRTRFLGVRTASD
jgi:hypothetical protein